MHLCIALHLFNEEISPLLISLPLNCFTIWLLVLIVLVASFPSLSLFDVDCTVHFFLLYSQSAAYHDSASFLPPPSWFSLFIFLFATLSFLHFLITPPQKNIWLLDHPLLPNRLWYGWRSDVADCWIVNFSPLFTPTFSLMVYWCVVYFRSQRLTSPLTHYSHCQTVTNRWCCCESPHVETFHVENLNNSQSLKAC